MPQRTQAVSVSLAILVWWTLCPKSAHLREGRAAVNEGLMTVDVGWFMVFGDLRGSRHHVSHAIEQPVTCLALETETAACIFWASQ